MEKLKEWTTNTLIVLGFAGSMLVFVPHPLPMAVGAFSILVLYLILKE